MTLKDRVAIVTGSAQGIGRAIALAFGQEGASVVVTDIQAKGKETEKEILSQRGNAIFLQGDVAIEEDVKRIVSATLGTFGRIDILVNNAGLRTIALIGVENCPVSEMKVEDWDKMIAVNLRGPFLMSKAVLPQMIKQKQGSIINISSGAGQKARPGKSAYSASKHGLEGFTKALAEEVRDFKIRVNALAPGGRVDVDGRGGLPVGLIVPACIFLASDDSQGISGQSITAKNWNEEKGIKPD